MTTMTPDQFFDALDELFGTDDGYVNHLKRIKKLKECVQDMAAAIEGASLALRSREAEKNEPKSDREIIKELKEEIKELKYELMMQEGRYDFLKETSIDKTMDTQSTDDIIKLENENKELKSKLKEQ